MLYLGGGGDENDSHPLDAAFAAQIAGGRLLYLPMAMDSADRSYTDCETWIHSVFEPLRVTEIIMWRDFADVKSDDLDFYDGIYIGGGNTYLLLDAVRTRGFDEMLREFIRTDRPVYGGSAGAILLGLDIATCAHMDENKPGLMDTAGLGMLGQYSVWCHYTSADDERIRMFGHPVIAIPERTGVVYDAAGMRVLGAASVVRFDDSCFDEMPPNGLFV